MKIILKKKKSIEDPDNQISLLEEMLENKKGQTKKNISTDNTN